MPATSALNDEENVDFLLALIMTAGSFEPDFEAAALEFNIQEKHNAQRKFKAIVEKSGKYVCKKNVITKKAAATTTAVDTATNTSRPSASAASEGDPPRKRSAAASKDGGSVRKKAKKDEDA